MWCCCSFNIGSGPVSAWTSNQWWHSRSSRMSPTDPIIGVNTKVKASNQLIWVFCKCTVINKLLQVYWWLIRCCWLTGLLFSWWFRGRSRKLLKQKERNRNIWHISLSQKVCLYVWALFALIRWPIVSYCCEYKIENERSHFSVRKQLKINILYTI